MLSTTMPIEVCTEALETFGRHVIPEYDKDPVHSTTRQREAQLPAVQPPEAEGGMPPLRV
jgi:hypothetical protein